MCKFVSVYTCQDKKFWLLQTTSKSNSSTCTKILTKWIDISLKPCQYFGEVKPKCECTDEIIMLYVLELRSLYRCCCLSVYGSEFFFFLQAYVRKQKTLLQNSISIILNCTWGVFFVRSLLVFWPLYFKCLKSKTTKTYVLSSKI